MGDLKKNCLYSQRFGQVCLLGENGSRVSDVAHGSLVSFILYLSVIFDCAT